MTTSYLFAYYILDSQVSLFSSMSIKTGLFFILTFCFIITPISGIINYYYGSKNRKKKSGENNKQKCILTIRENFKNSNPNVQFCLLL